MSRYYDHFCPEPTAAGLDRRQQHEWEASQATDPDEAAGAVRCLSRDNDEQEWRICPHACPASPPLTLRRIGCATEEEKDLPF